MASRSGLTVRLSGKLRTGSYRTALGQNLPGGWIVPRADVAQFMLRAAVDPGMVKQFVRNGNGR